MLPTVQTPNDQQVSCMCPLVTMKLLVLCSILTVVYSRPQVKTAPSQHDPSVQIEKHEVVELEPQGEAKMLFDYKDEKRMAENTKDILDKIEAINRSHGYSTKQVKKQASFFPVAGYFSRSQDDAPQGRKYNFEFSQTPFSNPVFNYLDKVQESEMKKNVVLKNGNSVRNYESYVNENAEVVPEDYVPGQYIKRKVTHHQTYLMPSVESSYMAPNFYQNVPPQMMQPSMIPYQHPPVPYPTLPAEYFPSNDLTVKNNLQKMKEVYSGRANTPEELKSNENKKKLEKQTIDNIKNIVNSEPGENKMPPASVLQSVPRPEAYPYPPIIPFPHGPQYFPVNLPQMAQNPAMSYTQPPGGRFNITARQAVIPLPFQEYFPIVIKNPFQMMYNAITSMVEYGPNSDVCSPAKEERATEDDSPPEDLPLPESDSPPQIPEKNVEKTANLRTGKSLEEMNLKSKISLMETVTSPKHQDTTSSSDDVIEITDIQIPSGDIEDGVVEIGEIDINDNYREGRVRKREENEKFEKKYSKYTKPTAHQDEMEDLKLLGDKKKLVSLDNNKHQTDTTNSGSGIFVSKLKVRRGGVAIAGPGGIATAGSGGTAIVGPNGYAYTQPDSLAIAGSGTKVVAVDPSVNLRELVDRVNSKKTADAEDPRVGRVVAIGPVIYYNKG